MFPTKYIVKYNTPFASHSLEYLYPCGLSYN
jgi:hypothetical protein